MIPAHDNPLAAIAFNSTATRIATASEKVASREKTLLAIEIHVTSVLMFLIQVHHHKFY